jgi:hypothetical protein
MEILAELAALTALDQNSGSQDPLFALIIGTSGAGKSTAIGSAEGRILYIHGAGEVHGPKAAATNPKATVIPFNLEQRKNADGVLIDCDPDEAMARLWSVLNQPLWSQFDHIAVDGLCDIEKILLLSKACEKFCTNDKGKFVRWDTVKYVTQELGRLVKALGKLSAHGMGVFVTCIGVTDSDFSAEAGTLAIQPKLQGHGVIETIIPQFPDIILAARIERDDEVGHAFLFHNVVVTKSQKDANGETKKVSAYSPRLTGLYYKETPPILAANLALALKYKRREKAVKGSKAKVENSPAVEV